MHVKASVSARMSLVRLVQYSLVLFTCIFPFTEQINDDDEIITIIIIIIII